MQNFWKNEDGLELVEYGITAGLIALAVVALFTAIGGSLSTIFNALNEKLNDAAANAS